VQIAYVQWFEALPEPEESSSDVPARHTLQAASETLKRGSEVRLQKMNAYSV
jgi:hypothetical protein